ncbi:hypothetical protein [Streptomyces kanasensis]|uniref:hypothetical protein n=1 Tax=Streptomyces kanasensis TaxID=936756 RepID=UPI0036F87DD0
MGSLRNPVGPLPSSIYWRRRAVLAGVVALLALLVAWFVSSGDGDGGKGGDGANGASPAPSITPGPSPSGPAISAAPGGRDDTGGSGGTGGTGGTAGSGGTAGAGGSGGTASGAGGPGGTGTGGAGSGGGAAAGGAGGGQGGATGSARLVPADSPLPHCVPGALQLTLSSTKVSYAPGEEPRFRLTARNTSATGCKTDLGPATAVLTISDGKDEEIWSSDDCLRGDGRAYVSVPAGGTATYTVAWDRRHSAPRCGTPSPRVAGPGTYLAEATVPGVKGVLRSSITLAKD